ncbi:MAG TPA: hypothetical protein VH854_11775 [Thermoanaerobaculia bacterium]|jgi:hypothetical protein|nr:hypothetical protein [Thermoanaerobaculia bacterium]
MSPRGAIAFGCFLSAVGLSIIAASVWASSDKFQAPRWVVAGIGGAFVFFGSYLAVIYALGFDPARSDETLPPPIVQLAFFVPGLSLFALPFHWVAFGSGPRQFSGSVSLPFLSFSHGTGAVSGRIWFGAFAVLIDLLILGTAIKLVRKAAGD